MDRRAADCCTKKYAKILITRIYKNAAINSNSKCMQHNALWGYRNILLSCFVICPCDLLSELEVNKQRKHSVGSIYIGERRERETVVVASAFIKKALCPRIKYLNNVS
jgi:hypothetical protein